VLLALFSPRPLATAQDASPARNVALVVWDRINLIELTGPAEVFWRAGGFDVYTVAETPAPVMCSCLRITPEYTFDNCPKPDVILIPGAGREAIGSQKLIAWLRRVTPEARAVLSVCNGSIVLAHAGLLEGHEATAAEGNVEDLMIFGGNVKGYVNRRFVDSGKFVTAQSYFAGVDGALHVITKLRGQDAARRIAEQDLYNWEPDRWATLHAEPGRAPKSRRKEILDTILRSGVDAAVARYRQMAAEDSVGYSPELARIPEESLFQFLAWGLQYVNRADDSVKLGEFMCRIFPQSARSRAALGEAHFEAGRADAALTHLLAALDIDPSNRRTLHLMRRVLTSTTTASSDTTRRVRGILRDTAWSSSAVIPPDGEPGEPLSVSGTILDPSGNPVAGAVVYAYHTDARGYYSPGGMDELNPRLFAYLKTGADGRYEFRTIRPGHYPDQTEPVEQHIHFEVTAPGFARKIWRLGFTDDPFWSGRAEPPSPRWVRPVTKGPFQIDQCVCDITVQPE
jgi:protocatechuate 3,4-dioxygenase beta subunit/putative intracellular protease/amidase